MADHAVTSLGSDLLGLLVGRADGSIRREGPPRGAWQLPAAVVAIAACGELRFAATASGEVFRLGKAQDTSSIGVLPGVPRQLSAHPDGGVEALVGDVLYIFRDGKAPAVNARGLSGFAYCDDPTAGRSITPDNPVDPWSVRADLAQEGILRPPFGGAERALPGKPTHIALSPAVHALAYAGQHRVGVAPTMGSSGGGQFDFHAASQEAVVFLAFVGGSTLVVVHADGRGFFLTEHSANILGRINAGAGVRGGCVLRPTRQVVLLLNDGSLVRVPWPDGEGVTFLAAHENGVIAGDFRGKLAGYPGRTELIPAAGATPVLPTWTCQTGQDWRAVYASAGSRVLAGGMSGSVELLTGAPPAVPLSSWIAGPVDALAFSDDGRIGLIGCGRRGTAAIEVSSGISLWTTEDDTGLIAVASAPDSTCLALDWRGGIRRLDPRTGALSVARERGPGIRAWASSGALLCLDHVGELEVLDARSLVTTATFPVDAECSGSSPPLHLGGRAPHWALLTPPDGRTLLLCRGGGELRVHSAADGQLLAARAVPPRVRCMAVDALRALVHVGFEDATYASFALADLASTRDGELPATPTHMAVDGSGGLWAGGVNSDVWRIG